MEDGQEKEDAIAAGEQEAMEAAFEGGGDKEGWEAMKACCQVLVFITFLILFSIIIMVDSDPFERNLQAQITTHFHQKFNSFYKPNAVNTHEKFWDYLEHGFLVGTYGKCWEDMTPVPQPMLVDAEAYVDENGNIVQPEVPVRLREGAPLHPCPSQPGMEPDITPLPSLGGNMYQTNRIMGAVQMRQVRVEPGNPNVDPAKCGGQLAYSAYFTMCVPAYSVETEAKSEYPDSGSTTYTYQEMVTTPMPGVYALYSGGGYVEMLSNNKTETVTLLRELRENNWLDITTRAVMLDFNLWNPNLEMYVVVRLLFEVSPIGIWNYNVRVLILKPRYLRLFGNNSAFEWFMTICEAMVLLFVLYYVAEEVSEMVVSMSEYFQDGWNLIDWASLTILILFFYIRVDNYIVAGDFAPMGLMEIDDHKYYESLQYVAERMASARSLNSFNVVLIWLKVVKYIPFLPYSRVLKEIFAACWQLFVSFAVIFSIFFVGFGLAFNVGFGMDYEELQSWPISWVYLGRSLLGDVDVTKVYRNNPWSGSILLGFFVLGVYMVLMNLWYALILYAFSLTRERIVESQEARGEKPILDTLMDGIAKGIKEKVNIMEFIKKFPGLHARTVEKWRRENVKTEKRREKRLALELDRTNNQRLDRARSGFSLMRFNKTLDRGAAMPDNEKRMGMGVMAIQDQEQADDASSVSEASLDIGPLSPTKIHTKKKWKKRMGLVDPIVPEMFELEEAVVAIGNQIRERITHIGQEVADEMKETKEVLSGINDVIGVVSRRVKDLDTVQKQYL
jgi:hypothetical protein